MAQMRKDYLKFQLQCEDLKKQNERLRESFDKCQTMLKMKEQEIQQLRRDKEMLEAEVKDRRFKIEPEDL